MEANYCYYGLACPLFHPSRCSSEPVPGGEEEEEERHVTKQWKNSQFGQYSTPNIDLAAGLRCPAEEKTDKTQAN